MVDSPRHIREQVRVPDMWLVAPFVKEGETELRVVG